LAERFDFVFRKNRSTHLSAADINGKCYFHRINYSIPAISLKNFSSEA
jgi:hypothetical protein